MIKYNNKQLYSCMQQVEFVLQNFFIIRPNKSSKYKLKIAINHETSEQKYIDRESQYKFKFSINDHLLEKPYGYISLLERTSSNQNKHANYLQIGKGQLDFNDIITNSENSNISMLNGVIYGTRAQNFDKLIAKYGYQIVKSSFQPSKIEKSNKQGGTPSRIKFKNHKATEKLPSIKLNQSVLEQSNQINAKIRKLTSTIMQENQDQQTVHYSSLSIEPRQIVSQSEFQDKQTIDKYQPNRHYFKIGEKILSTIMEEKTNGLKWIQIKNIQINKYQSNAKITNNIRSDFILIKIMKNTFSKLFQIILKLQFNTSNRFLNLIFTIPTDLQTINIQIVFMESKTQLLQGSLTINSSINKIVELYSSINNQQTGFINIEVLKNRPQDYNIDDYTKQLEDFDHLYKKFTNVLINQQTLNKITIPSVTPFLTNYIRQNKDLQLSRERFYSISSNKKSNEKLKNIPVRIKRNVNMDTNESIVATPKRTSKAKSQISPLNSLYLKIKNIYLNMYDQTNQQLFLKFIVRQKGEARQINNGFNNLDQSNNSIILDDLSPYQQIKVHCYSSYSNQKAQLLGKCSINVRDIIKSTTKQMKIFITNQNCIIGFIILELSLYRIKNNKIRAYNKPQLPTNLSLNRQEYELQLSPNQVRHTQNLSSKVRYQTDFNTSFLVEQSNFR